MWCSKSINFFLTIIKILKMRVCFWEKSPTSASHVPLLRQTNPDGSYFRKADALALVIKWSLYFKNMSLGPRPHYKNDTVLFRFQEDSHPHLSFLYRFGPSTLQRVSALKTLLNLIFFYILPPFFLHYFPRNKLKLSHYPEVRPDLVSNHHGFSGLRPSRFSISVSASFRPKLAS